MNLNKICNKLIFGYYDKWCPVVAENGSPPSTFSRHGKPVFHQLRTASCLFHCLLRSLHIPWTHCIASECWHTLPSISPPTDNSLATNHRPFPSMETGFPPTTDCLLPLPLPSTKSPHSLDPLHCLRMLAHSTQTSVHPRTTHLPLTTDLFQAWKTGFPPTADCLPACYQVCTLREPTALPQNAGILYPDTSPPTDNSLATNHRPFPGMKNRFSTNCGQHLHTQYFTMEGIHRGWTPSPPFENI